MQTKTFLTFLLLLFVLHCHGQLDSLGRFGRIEALFHGANQIVSPKDSGELRVITASRSEKYVSDLPLSIYIITHEEIINNGYITLTDAIKSLPGIRVSQPGTGELGEGFQLRGLSGNLYTKILINNLPVKPSVAAGLPIGSQLPIRQAERIEVIYGPAAAIYGADAVTGVINIVLKEADQGTFARGDILIGSGNFAYTNFTIGGKTGKNRDILQYSFYGSKSEFPKLNIINGHEKTFNTLALLHQNISTVNINGNLYAPLEINEALLSINGMTTEQFTNTFYGPNYKGSLTTPNFEKLSASSYNIGLNLKYRGVGIMYSNMYRQSHSSLGLSPLLFRYDNPQNYWAEKIQQINMAYSHEFSKFSSTTNLMFLSYEMDNTSSMGLTRYNSERAYLYSTSLDILAEQLVNFYPTKASEIVLGTSYQISSSLPLTSFLDKPFPTGSYSFFSNKVNENHPLMGKFGYNPTNFHNGAIFGQIYFTLHKFRFLGGIRYDANSMYSNSFSPRIAILYKLNKNISANIAAGTAFKTPPASISYRSLSYVPIGEPDRVKYLVIPSEKINPEQYRSIEAGTQINLRNGNIIISLSTFYNEISNPIISTSIPINTITYPLATEAGDSLWAFTYMNSHDAKSRLWGGQANIKFLNITKAYKLNAELNLSIAQQTEKSPGLEDLLANFQLMPKHMGQFKISLQPLNFLKLNAEMVWMTKWLRVIIPFEEIYSKLFSNVDGFYTIDLSAQLKLGQSLNLSLKATNLLNEKYGGIGVTGFGYSLPYNPQFGRNFQLGLTYSLN